MPRYVIGPDVALHLAERETVVAAGHQLVAPTLIRSQLLSRLYRAVRDGTMTEAAAERRLDYVRTLRLRLLGDRVLQQVAWRIAFQLGWSRHVLVCEARRSRVRGRRSALASSRPSSAGSRPR
jgi:hypothetical protein